jgi:hypothetical protein
MSFFSHFDTRIELEESAMPSSSDESAPVQPAPTTRDVWNRRLVYLRIILITVILVGILFWLSSQIIVVLLILLVAALLAYAVDRSDPGAGGCILAVLSKDAYRGISSPDVRASG